MLRERGLKSRMTLQVHDELVFEVPENEVEVMQPLVREHMEKVHKLAVPLQVDMEVGANWRDVEWRWRSPRRIDLGRMARL